MQSELIPGVVRTATPMLAGMIVAFLADFGFTIEQRWANLIAFVVALAYYAFNRWQELKGKRWATRALAPVKPSTPSFTRMPPRQKGD